MGLRYTTLPGVTNRITEWTGYAEATMELMPGVIAGHYDYRQACIDLAPLAARAGFTAGLSQLREHRRRNPQRPLRPQPRRSRWPSRRPRPSGSRWRSWARRWAALAMWHGCGGNGPVPLTRMRGSVWKTSTVWPGRMTSTRSCCRWSVAAAADPAHGPLRSAVHQQYYAAFHPISRSHHPTQ